VSKKQVGHHQCISHCGYMALTVVTAEHTSSDGAAIYTNCVLVIGTAYYVSDLAQFAISHEGLSSRQVKHMFFGSSRLLNRK
jgi:hypothetical protein